MQLTVPKAHTPTLVMQMVTNIPADLGCVSGETLALASEGFTRAIGRQRS